MKNNIFVNLMIKCMPGSERIEGNRVFGKDEKGEILLVCSLKDKFHLTVDIYKEMLEECESLGLNEAMHIWGIADDGPKDGYTFHEMSISMVGLYGSSMDNVEII